MKMAHNEKTLFKYGRALQKQSSKYQNLTLKQKQKQKKNSLDLKSVSPKFAPLRSKSFSAIRKSTSLFISATDSPPCS